MKKLLMIIIAQFIFIGAANATVNINTATQEELQTLPGITATRAEAIINYRSKAGAFRRVEDVKNIEGIDDSTMDMMDFYNSVKLKD
jgi:competence protein ComEA